MKDPNDNEQNPIQKVERVLIGGSNDGLRFMFDEFEMNIRFPAVVKRPAVRAGARVDYHAMESYEYYRLCRIHDAKGRAFSFYISEGMSDTKALEMLIEGYRHERSK